jgi:hypothetical protein
MTSRYASFIFLAIACFALVCLPKESKSESMIGGRFEHELTQSIRPGMSRVGAEAQLRRLMVNFSFVSRREIEQEVLGPTMRFLSRATAGALRGTRLHLGRSKLAEAFASVVIYLDKNGIVLEVHSRVLWSGP